MLPAAPVIGDTHWAFFMEVLRIECCDGASTRCSTAGPKSIAGVLSSAVVACAAASWRIETMTHRKLWLWAAAGVAGRRGAGVGLPAAVSVPARALELARAEARTIALERLRELGRAGRRAPTWSSIWRTSSTSSAGCARPAGADSRAAGGDPPQPAGQADLDWEVVVYPPGARGPRVDLPRDAVLGGRRAGELAARVPAEEAGGESPPPPRARAPTRSWSSRATTSRCCASPRRALASAPRAPTPPSATAIASRLFGDGHAATACRCSSPASG